ncbi:MAG: hypothetical protein ACREGR_02505 [Minisyncoccia bacterium]
MRDNLDSSAFAGSCNETAPKQSEGGQISSGSLFQPSAFILSCRADLTRRSNAKTEVSAKAEAFPSIDAAQDWVHLFDMVMKPASARKKMAMSLAKTFMV